MFAEGSRTRALFHIVLIEAILLTVLMPNTATALSPSDNERTDLPPLWQDFKKQIVEFFSSVNFQNGTPTTEPTAPPSVTPSPELTPTPESQPTPANDTPLPTATDVRSPAPTMEPTEPGSLLVHFSASSEQVKNGDRVIFTLKITNAGQSDITGLQFSNTLPEGFIYVHGEGKDFVFNAVTRELTWRASEGTTLASGKSIELEYPVVVADLGTEEMQIIDTGVIIADGFAEPFIVETALTFSGTGKALNMLDTKGGKASGLDGRVKINFPEGVLNSSVAVLVQDLGRTQHTAGMSGGEPWFVFEIGLRSLNTQATRSLSVETSNEFDRMIPFEATDAKFEKPVELSVSLDGIADLTTLGADQTPFLVTLDEASGVWVRVPLKGIEKETNTITAELSHFSTWGVGLGPSFPQNGAGVLLFDSAYPSLFTGRSQYSLSIWTPPGRNGVQPNLTLSYSSGTVDGVLGDVQAPWVGMGWNIDTIEIARKISNGACSPCGSGSYGYENKFLLLFNGTGYELIPDGATPGRYHTKSESFLYIQLHNDYLGNNNPPAPNTSGEWWEVVEKDGTRWRLGFRTDSEQLTAMKGYPGAATGAWSSLGYAGHAQNVVAMRWRVDLVTDVYGNQMTFSYTEESRLVAGTTVSYDRANFLDTITYTTHISGSPSAGYSVVFVRESRGRNDEPANPTEWDHWETFLLDRIDVKYRTTVVRSYDLNYQVRSYTDDGKTWQTTTLASVTISGGGISAPAITFNYIDLNNRANCGSGCQEWAYPRLQSLSNGWGGALSYTYEHDGRPYTSWYNWRVKEINITDGVNASPMKTTFAYSGPCYNDKTAGWCNSENLGELIGYTQAIVTTLDFNGTTILGIAVHKFHTDEQKAGRTYEVQNQDAAGTILSQTNTTYTVITSNLPSGGYFVYASAIERYLRTSGLTRVSRTEYQYDASTGNLTLEKEFDGFGVLYRQTVYEYVVNSSPSYWILNTLSRRILKDASGAILSQQEYGYNGNLPGIGLPITNQADLSRLVSSTQTIDTKYIYDPYGNIIETRRYKSYGTTGNQPTGAFLTYTTSYDTELQTYALSSDPPLLPATITTYDYGLGLPITVTDPNGNTTTTTYDGLGRPLSVRYHGYAQPNVKYTYPTPPVGTPFAIKMEIWDETANVYRATWQVMDGLGRVIQTQSPYEAAGYLILRDTSYNALGKVLYTGLPRLIGGTGGSYFAPNWGSVPHTTTNYDALGRVLSITYSDSSVETFEYQGLRTILRDRNRN